MSRQFLRQCSISLTGSSSVTVSGGGPKDLAIEFMIGASTLQSPNTARARIYNPSPATIAAFKNKEFQTITISAGYQDNCGQIYQGDIKQSLYARETPVDAYIDIFSGDGQNAYQQSRVTKTLAAGWTPQDKVQVALDSMKPYGITGLGIVNVDLSTPQYPRGRPFIGMARDLIRQVALSAEATFDIQNGKVNIVSPNKPIPSSGTVVLNSHTGLIGFPQQSEAGIIARCLINPLLQIHSLVQIDESAINQAEADNSRTGGYGQVGDTNFALQNTGRIAADGLYHIIFMETSGSTRGQEWYQTLTCLATTASLNKSQADSYIGPAVGPIVNAL